MIKEFVAAFDKSREKLLQCFMKKHPDKYIDIVRLTLTTMAEHLPDYGYPDPENIHEINDGDYQGTLVYVIPEKGYQPYTYWYVKVAYGSCSGCDTLEGIRSYDDDPPTEDQAKEYLTLALHIVQGMKEMGDSV